MTTTSTHAVPLRVRPAKCQPVRDPLYDTLVARVTDPSDGYSGPGISVEYSRVEVENADGSLLVLRGDDGSWYVYHALTFKLLRQLRFGSGPQEPEPRWDASNPRLLYYLSGRRLMSLDVSRGQSATVHDFTDELPEFPEGDQLTTGSEGDASLDRRYWCFMLKDSRTGRSGLVITYDRVTGRVLGRLRPERDGVNWVSMSMSGEHCAVGWNENPVTIYRRDLSASVDLPRGAMGHGDFALLPDGAEVFVLQNVSTDWITMHDLATGRATRLILIPFTVNTDIGLHFSGNCQRTPGWVLVSTYGARLPPPGRARSWMDTQLFLLELRESPRLWRIASTRSYTSRLPSEEKAYFAEAFASINRQGTRIYWGSNWGQDDLSRTDTYAALLPPRWWQRLPPRRAAGTAPGRAD